MKQILIIQTAFIGDVILATGIVESIAKNVPNVEIDFLLNEVVINMPIKNTILDF